MDDGASVQTLPPLSALSSSVLSFLSHKLHTQHDLATAPGLLSELQSHCLHLDQTLNALNSKLQSSLLGHVSFSDRIRGLFDDASARLTDLCSLTRSPNSLSDGGGGEGGKEKILGEKLPALAKEVARVETVRAYADEDL